MQAKRSDVWEDANVLAVLVGGTSEDLRYLKSISLHLWLFGYELPGTAAACIDPLTQHYLTAQQTVGDAGLLYRTYMHPAFTGTL